MVYVGYTGLNWTDLQQTHRVDVSFDQVVFLWFQDQVVSPEGDDPRVPIAAGYLGQAV